MSELGGGSKSVELVRRKGENADSGKKPIPSDPASEIVHYPEAPLHTFLTVLVTVLASLIPITSIGQRISQRSCPTASALTCRAKVILYFVSNTLNRLAIAVAFTGLFAFCLAVTTQARRVEIFAATSA
jgi:hypothetical protein